MPVPAACSLTWCRPAATRSLSQPPQASASQLTPASTRFAGLSSMPAKAKRGAAAAAAGRTALLVQRANQVADPTISLPRDLMTFTMLLRVSSLLQELAPLVSAANLQQQQQQHNTQQLAHESACEHATHDTANVSQLPTQATPAHSSLQGDSTSDAGAQQASILTCKVSHYKAAQLPAAVAEWCFQLVKTTLKDSYTPVWGWNDADKRKQLQAKDSQFIIVWAPCHQPHAAQRDPNAANSLNAAAAFGIDKLQLESGTYDAACTSEGVTSCVLDDQQAIAYLNFRFEEGYYKDPVLYVYEVMVAPGWHRKGLASRLMHLAELMAWEMGMDKVVLTVLTDNQPAVKLYRALKYQLDKATPQPSKGYEILSKQRVKQ